MGTIRYTKMREQTSVVGSTIIKEFGMWHHGDYILHSAYIWPKTDTELVACRISLRSVEGDGTTQSIYTSGGHANMMNPFNLDRPVRFSAPAEMYMLALTESVQPVEFGIGVERLD